MSRWISGKTYDYYGDKLHCRRVFFDGHIEMVELAFVVAAPEEPKPFIRAARTLAPCVSPRVTETTGGVEVPDGCECHLCKPRRDFERAIGMGGGR